MGYTPIVYPSALVEEVAGAVHTIHHKMPALRHLCGFTASIALRRYSCKTLIRRPHLRSVWAGLGTPRNVGASPST